MTGIQLLIYEKYEHGPCQKEQDYCCIKGWIHEVSGTACQDSIRLPYTKKAPSTSEFAVKHSEHQLQGTKVAKTSVRSFQQLSSGEVCRQIPF